MIPAGLKKRLAHLAVLAIALTGAVAVHPGTAQAAQTCNAGYFCWYYLENQEGSTGRQAAYTSGWVRMGSLVDDSRSSMDSQTGTSCGNPNRRPWVYLSDTYQSTRWTALLGQNRLQRVNTFNTVYTNYGNLNMNDKFNDVWNRCW